MHLISSSWRQILGQMTINFRIIHSFNGDIVSTNYVPDTVLGVLRIKEKYEMLTHHQGAQGVLTCSGMGTESSTFLPGTPANPL